MSGAGKIMKNKPHLVFWELVLILASVLVFRGLWRLLDKVEWMNHRAGLWASLATSEHGVTIRSDFKPQH